jgi:hypothetical protein
VAPQHQQPGVVGLGATRELGEQGRLPAARLAHDEHRADAVGVDPPQGVAEGRELPLARHEEGRSVVAGGVRPGQMATGVAGSCADPPDLDRGRQARRLRLRLQAQLRGQQAPAGLVLRERRGALALAREQAHEVAVGRLVPWLDARATGGSRPRRRRDRRGARTRGPGCGPPEPSRPPLVAHRPAQAAKGPLSREKPSRKSPRMRASARSRRPRFAGRRRRRVRPGPPRAGRGPRPRRPSGPAGVDADPGGHRLEVGGVFRSRRRGPGAGSRGRCAGWPARPPRGGRATAGRRAPTATTGDPVPRRGRRAARAPCRSGSP